MNNLCIKTEMNKKYHLWFERVIDDISRINLISLFFCRSAKSIRVSIHVSLSIRGGAAAAAPSPISQVIIKDPPTLLSRPNNEYIKNVGDEVSFSCQAAENPSTDIRWKRVRNKNTYLFFTKNRKDLIWVASALGLPSGECCSSLKFFARFRRFLHCSPHAGERITLT